MQIIKTKENKTRNGGRIPTLRLYHVFLLCASFSGVIAADVEEREEQMVLLMELGRQLYLDLQREKDRLPNVLQQQACPGKAGAGGPART